MAEQSRSSLAADVARDVAQRLLEWYSRCGRPLPWRAGASPYEILVSEVMLQQTQVATVVPHYCRFLEKFPNVGTLAAASPDDVLAAWVGLGYYRRALNLHRAARQIVQEFGGEIPSSRQDLLRLPGVGEYTARAVRLFAFGIPDVPLDANLERVLARLLNQREPVRLKCVRRRLEEAVEEMFRFVDPSALVHALMDLGATVCAPRLPLCQRCPVASACKAFAAGTVEQIPAKARPATVELVHEWRVVLFNDRSEVLLWQRRADQRWGGLWEFLRVERTPANSRRAIPPAIARELRKRRIKATALGVAPPLRYAVTRYRVVATPWIGRWIDGPGLPDLHDEHTQASWVPVSDVLSFALSSPQRRIAQAVLEWWRLNSTRDPRA